MHTPSSSLPSPVYLSYTPSPGITYPPPPPRGLFYLPHRQDYLPSSHRRDYFPSETGIIYPLPLGYLPPFTYRFPPNLLTSPYPPPPPPPGLITSPMASLNFRCRFSLICLAQPIKTKSMNSIMVNILPPSNSPRNPPNSPKTHSIML